MRGVVAALRASPRRSGSAAAAREQSRWKIVTVAFIVGVVVGALTLIALTRSL